MNCAVSVEHYILSEVLGIMMVAAVLQREYVEVPLMTGCQFAKGICVTLLGSCDQFGLFSRGLAHSVVYRHHCVYSGWQDFILFPILPPPAVHPFDGVLIHNQRRG